jgi:hypothetical protein
LGGVVAKDDADKTVFVVYNISNKTMPHHPSETEKNPDALAASATEKEPDFAELQKEKERLFKEAEDASLELTDKQKEVAVSLVAGYSVKDGLELARRIGLEGGRTFKALTYPSVVFKNKKFFLTCPPPFF